MHSRIFELTQANLNREDWATENNFVYDEEKMDYSEELHGDERMESIDWLKSSPLGRLFAFDKDTLTFMGKDALMDVRKDWIASIKNALEVMENKCLYNTFGLNYATKKVLDSHFMFCLPEYTGDGAVYPCELLEWLNTIKDGAVIHINSVFDYRY